MPRGIRRMISIERGECPAVLEHADPDGSSYSDPTVVDALSSMQHGKCCYCEKYIDKSGNDRAVEHFRPKATNKFPELKNTWSNLLHVCAACNGKKSAKFPVDEEGNPLFLDPSDPSVNPEDHMEFNVNHEDDIEFAKVSAKNDEVGESKLGAATIKELDLDGVRCRRDRVAGFARLFTAYMEIWETTNQTTKEQKVHTFELRLGANNQHAAFARAFARAMNLDKRFGVQILQGAQVEPE